MNRLAVPAASSTTWHDLIPSPPSKDTGLALANPHTGKSIASPAATFLPLNYEPGYAYPLLIWLHDAGNSERHLPQVMQHLSTQNFVAVAPRGPNECSQVPRGYRWMQHPTAIAAADEAVYDAVEMAKTEFNVHDRRVFLVGHGEGGTMAMRLAMQSPERFAGVASLNGRLPQKHGLLRNVNRLRELPLFLASARECPTYPEATVCSNLRLLHSAGCNVALRQYPGDDDLTTCMLADINRWAMDQVCGS